MAYLEAGGARRSARRSADRDRRTPSPTARRAIRPERRGNASRGAIERVARSSFTLPFASASPARANNADAILQCF